MADEFDSLREMLLTKGFLEQDGGSVYCNGTIATALTGMLIHHDRYASWGDSHHVWRRGNCLNDTRRMRSLYDWGILHGERNITVLCLHKQYSKEEFLEMYDDSYWTDREDESLRKRGNCDRIIMSKEPMKKNGWGRGGKRNGRGGRRCLKRICLRCGRITLILDWYFRESDFF